MSSAVDLFFVYQFIKRLTTPFDETEAFNLGLIDENGKRLKKAKTREEKEAMTTFDKLIFNLKRILAKVPGGNTKLGSYAAALFLIREGSLPDDEKYIQERILEEMAYLEEHSDRSFKQLFGEEIANVTGSNVAGTGDDPVHWRKKGRGRPKVLNRFIDVSRYLKREEEKRKKRNKKQNAEC